MTSPNADPLRSERQIFISHLRPLILKALGLREEDVTEETISLTYPLPQETSLECSAVKIGDLLITSVSYTGPNAQISPDVRIIHKIRHDLLGDSDITKEIEYTAFDEEGNELTEEEVAEIFGEPIDDMHFTCDSLGIFDDYEFLFGALSSLAPGN
jgi:hypothetical protein